jgi:glycosyltransferase involved in cell wall biosynthesis
LDKNIITALIITKNEESNISRCLDSLSWLNNILVIDSYSDDQTITLINQRPNCHIMQRNFDSFSEQCNFGLSKITTDWVLSIDADYIFPRVLANEILNLSDEKLIYNINFSYCINGKTVKAGILPKRPMLFPKENSFYYNEGHAHRLKINYPEKTLIHKVKHDDRKNFSRWLENQIKYAKQEAIYLIGNKYENLRWSGRIRKIPFLSVPLIMVYVFIIRGACLEIWHGWIYTFQRLLAEILINFYYIKLLLTKLKA